MSDTTLFRDITIFEIHYTPDTIKYRDLQMQQLAEVIRPVLLGGRPLNTILRGPPGTGKTTCVQEIFSEVEADIHCVIPVLINCKNIHTEFRVFAKIFVKIFGHKPPLSGIPVQRLTDPIGAYLLEHNTALIICLDDAECLIHNHLLDKVLRPLLCMYEEYPGVRTGVITTMNVHTPFIFDPAVLSVYQPEEILFPLYVKDEVKGILRERIRKGIYPGVIPSDIFDLITSLTVETGDLRVGINLLKRSVIHAEQNARTVVTEADVLASFTSAQMDNLIGLTRGLKGADRRLLLHLAGMKHNKDTIITSGTLFTSFTYTDPLSYTAFYNRLNKLADLRLIDLIEGSVKGNTREVVLRYDPLKVIGLLSKPN